MLKDREDTVKAQLNQFSSTLTTHCDSPSLPSGITPMLQLIRRISADPGDNTKCSLIFANQVIIVIIIIIIIVKMLLVCGFFFLLQYLLFLFRQRKTSFWGKSWRRWRRTIQTNWTSGSRWINLHRVRQLFFQLFLAAWSVNRKRLNQHVDKPRMAVEISPVLCTLSTTWEYLLAVQNQEWMSNCATVRTTNSLKEIISGWKKSEHPPVKHPSGPHFHSSRETQRLRVSQH